MDQFENREPPDLMVVISRDEVESRNTGPLLGSLRRLSESEADLHALRGSVDLSVHGYDDDNRELFEIPAVCDYFRLLATQFPYLFWFMSTESPTLRVVASCVSGARRTNTGTSHEVGISVDDSGLIHFIEQQFAGLNKLFADFGLDRSHPGLNEEISMRVIRYLSPDNRQWEQD